MEYFGRIAFDALIFSICLSFISCEENSEHYEQVSELSGKICPSADITFMQKAASKIECASMCKKDITCKSMVYSPADTTCSGCCQSLYGPSWLWDIPGTVFFKSSIGSDVGYTYNGVAVPAGANVDCGTLSFDDPHVLLGPHNGDNSAGASIAYTCRPCTYFPSSTPAVITCLDTGVWSSPSCVFGSDVGYTYNGVAVPAGAKGCLSEMGKTCSPSGKVTKGFTMQGTTARCLCDNICCGFGDCCYDADCFTP